MDNVSILTGNTNLVDFQAIVSVRFGALSEITIAVYSLESIPLSSRRLIRAGYQ
jgi:hypothetical protein